MTLEAVLQENGLEANLGNLVEIPAAPDHRVQLLSVVATPFLQMQRRAKADGVELVAVSGFRSLARQTAIWNGKFRRSVDEFGDRQSALCKVLEFSAPPGWSRHHWGTDIDLVSAELGHEPRLSPQDWQAGGPCGLANEWLSEHAKAFGFCRPYEEDYGGFSAEPWHWSFLPTASTFLPLMRRIDWKMVYGGEAFEASDLLAAQVNRLFPRFVMGINPALV